VSLDLAGQNALVFGGAGGIGAAVVRALAKANAEVVCVDVRPPAPDVGPATFLAADVTDAAAVQQVTDEAASRLGGLDHLVFSAGVTRDRVLWKLTDDAWDLVIDVNLRGGFYVARAAVPHLRARAGNRSITLISSINGERGKRGQANYAASKGGLNALAKTCARELGHFGIRVNAVAPGLVLTPMTAELPADALTRAEEETALGRLGRPEDVANAVLFLASSLAAHVTGQVLRVDGGQLIA